MNRFKRKYRMPSLHLLAAMGVALTASTGFASEEQKASAPLSEGTWRIELSPYTHHYRFSEEHKDVWAIGLERETQDHSLYGLMTFSNSFGQPSAYGYYGHVYRKVWNRFESLYLKWTVGVIYGYKVPFEDKVLFNHNGFSPAIIPAVGWRFDQSWSAQVNMLGTAAFMLMVTKKL